MQFQDQVSVLLYVVIRRYSFAAAFPANFWLLAGCDYLDSRTYSRRSMNLSGNPSLMLLASGEFVSGINESSSEIVTVILCLLLVTGMNTV